MKLKIAKPPTQSESEFDEIDLSVKTRRGVEYFIGRSPDSDLILDSEDVSRQHGKIFFHAGNYYFCDLGSRNGTIINGKLAEKNHSYILKNGDFIRIGDFALSLEEDMSDAQSETVVRIINPSIFSNWKSGQNVSGTDIETPSYELLNEPQEVPELVNNESIALETPIVKENDTLEESNVVQSATEVAGSPDLFIPNNIDNSQTDSAISNVINESIEPDKTTPVEEATANIDGVESEYTIVQVRDIFQNNEDNVDSDAEEIAAQTLEGDEQETIRQEDNVDSDAQEIAAPTLEGDEQENIRQEDNVDSDAKEIAAQTLEGDEQETIHQEDNIDSDAQEIAAQTLEGDDQEIIRQEDNIDSDAQEIAAPTLEGDEQEIIRQEDNIDSDAQEIAAPTLEGDEQETIRQEDNIGSDAEKIAAQTLESDEQQSESEIIEASSNTEKDVIENILEEESLIKIAKILEDKQIILISHETKKSKLTELVAEHEEFLSYCLTRTWQNFSDYLYRETGLSVTQELPSATSGGYQAINSLINAGEIIAVIFLRDFTVPQPGQASEEALLRICNINEILLATNWPTAQAVINYLKNMKDS
ncbi:FHA domain-containing protein [Nostoc linckia FACHB-104]|nr:FHA domain-containing protein [Nostoc linckia FACHB-104]